MALDRINVQIGADVSALRTGVNQAKATLGSLKTAATSLAGTLGGIFAVGTVRDFIGELARVQDLADRFGGSAEEMQRIGYVAEQNGASLEQMAAGLQRATVAAEAARNGNKKAADAFKDLNIDVDKFAKAPLSEKLGMLADGFNSARSQGEGMAAVLAIMGKAGGELIPTLQQGGQAVREMAGEIEVASNESVKAMAELDDSIAKFGASSKAPIAELLAFLVKLGKTILDVAQTAGKGAGSMIGFVIAAAKAAASGDTQAIRDAFDLFITDLEQDRDDFLKSVGQTFSGAPETSKPKPVTRREDPSKFDPFNAFGIGADADEYGPATNEGVAEDKRLKAARRYYAFLESKRAIMAGITATDERLAGMDRAQGTVTSDLTARGYGGAVYGGQINKEYQELIKHSEFLRNQLSTLESIERNTATGLGMRP